MACNLATTQGTACATGIGKLDGQIPLLQITAQSMALWLAAISPGTSVTLPAIQARACTTGIAKLDDEVQLLQVTAQNLCGLIS